MLSQQICYLLLCDGCGETCDTGEGIPHFRDAEDASKWVSFSEWSDWREVNGEHLCPNCFMKPHEFVQHEKATGFTPHPYPYCKRCDLHVDEHDEELKGWNGEENS